MILTLAVGCRGNSTGDGGWVFTATVNVSGQGDQPVDLAAGAGFRSTDTMFSIHGETGSGCNTTVDIAVNAPLATQTYVLGAESGSAGAAFAVYSDGCTTAGYPFSTGTTGGDITVTRADGSCAAPPCIDATFGFSVSEPTSPTSSRTILINNGHVSNY